MTPDLDGAKDFFALEESGLKFVFDLNITSAFLVTQVFAKDMIATGGNIINISSMNAYRPLTKIPAYSAAKAGISNFTQWLAVHFAPCGIRCNAIAPGFIVTEMTDATTDAQRKFWMDMVPMRRGGQPEEVANVALFLASDLASYVSGQVINCCGGLTP
jgi:NAD(P)-dependent dehydrogenase (short-subunit alcohol dehydrogenase family)